MKMDCRAFTNLVIHKDGEFLVGCMLGTQVLRWSNSPYDAWMTRNTESASIVAEKVDGEIYLFNPIVGQIRQYGGVKHDAMPKL